MAAERRHLGDSRSEGRTTFLELFLDLVYVFALTRLSQRLTDDFTVSRRTMVSELGQTALVLLALWQVWLLHAWATSRFDPRRIEIQLLTVATMFAAMIMAVSLPQAFGDRGEIFAVTFVAIQLGRAGFLALALRGHHRQPSTLRILFWVVLSSALWIAGALTGGLARGMCWTAGVVLEFVGAALRWPTPGLGRSDAPAWGVGSTHLAERYQQILLIAVGEAILLIGFVLSNVGFAIERTTTFVAAFVVTVLFWRIYFYQAGRPLADALARAPDPLRFSRAAGYTHLIMLCGIITTAVGYGLVIAHPFQPRDFGWLGIILGGPALFLLGRIWYEREVFGKAAGSRWYGLLGYALLSPVALLVPMLAVPLLGTAVLAAVVVADAAMDREHLLIEPNPPL